MSHASPRRAAEGPLSAASPPPRRSADAGGPTPSPDRTWLSIVIAPLVIGLSLLLAFGIRWAVDPGQPAPPAPTPSPKASPAVASPSPSPSPSPTSGQRIELNDTGFTMPSSWVLVADEELGEARRTVRVEEPISDVRLQAATPGAVDESLEQTCQALMSLQSEAYSPVTINPLVPVTVPAGGSGLSCGFEGVRSADQMANVVSFVLLQRDQDGQVLTLRATVPSAEPVSSTARAELASMQCEVSSGFGVPLPLC